MPKKIDARGLTCPQPAMLAKQAIDEGYGEIIILADDAVARDNIQRIGEKYDYRVAVEKQGNEFIIKILKTPD